METVKVSICISVYNTEKYLPRCLDSVVSQTLKEIEIVLVNNGSTDSSLQIMKAYQEKFPEMIKVISQEDKGLAQGRQTGINNAEGEYIAFLDADDYVKPQTYEEMYKCAMDYNADIVECQTKRDDQIISSHYVGLKSAEQILIDYFKFAEIPTMLWLRIYKRNLFEKPVLPNFYTNNEDNFALPCLLYKARNIFYLKKQLHYYSTDNEAAVMYRIKNKSVEQEKIIENRTKTLEVINHISDFIGHEVIEKNFSYEYKMFSSRIVLQFCTYDFEILSADNRISIVSDILGISKEELIKKYKHPDYPKNRLAKLMKLFGLRRGLVIYLFIKKIIYKRRSNKL